MHFIKYNSYAQNLEFYDEEQSRLKLLPLKMLAKYHIEFKKPVKCTGYWDGKKWHPCPKKMEGTAMCSYCKEKDATRFFAKADEKGFEELFEKYKGYEYSVYLALFGNAVKCGVTRSERLTKRLREQGARYFVELLRIKGMKEAYQWESYLQQRYNFRNAVRGEEKLEEHDDISVLIEWVDRLKKDLGDKLNGSLQIMKNLGIKSYKNAIPSNQIDGLVVGLRADIVFWQKENMIFYTKLNKYRGFSVGNIVVEFENTHIQI